MMMPLDSVKSDAAVGLKEIMLEAFNKDMDVVDGGGDTEDGGWSKRRGHQQKLDWRAEWLVYCMYAKCNISMSQLEPFWSLPHGDTQHCVRVGKYSCPCFAEDLPNPDV